MLRDMVAIGGMANWLLPLWHMWQDLTHGPRHLFLIPDEDTNGYTARQIERILQDAGCETWGLDYLWSGPGNITFFVRVPKAQAWRGWRALEAAGVVPENPPEPARGAQRRQSQAKRSVKRKSQERGLLDKLDDLVGW